MGETKEGEDDGALVCEFGALKRGLTTMIPGESRRFWISSDIKARLVDFNRNIEYWLMLINIFTLRLLWSLAVELSCFENVLWSGHFGSDWSTFCKSSNCQKCSWKSSPFHLSAIEHWIKHTFRWTRVTRKSFGGKNWNSQILLIISSRVQQRSACWHWSLVWSMPAGTSPAINVHDKTSRVPGT